MPVGLTLFFFLGAVSGAVASALFCGFGYLAGDRRLVRMTLIAVVVCGVMAFFLARGL